MIRYDGVVIGYGGFAVYLGTEDDSRVLTNSLIYGVKGLQVMPSFRWIDT